MAHQQCLAGASTTWTVGHSGHNVVKGWPVALHPAYGLVRHIYIYISMSFLPDCHFAKFRALIGPYA